MPHVSLHVWRIPPARIGAALSRVALDRARLRALPGVEFAKVLGTGRAFTPGGVDATRWAVLVAWRRERDAEDFEGGTVARAWGRIATASCRLDLAPVASRGTWAGARPFDPAGPASPRPLDGAEPASPRPSGRAVAPSGGPVVAITRARLRPARAVRFWRAIRPVASSVSGADGLFATFGIGEAPLGWQGTVSVWRDASALRAFAYRDPAHAAVVAATPAERWYAEELFARFTLLGTSGDRDVLGWRGLAGIPDGGGS